MCLSLLYSISSTSATAWGETQCVSRLLPCRRLCLISHLTSCHLERDDFLDTKQMFQLPATALFCPVLLSRPAGSCCCCAGWLYTPATPVPALASGTAL